MKILLISMLVFSVSSCGQEEDEAANTPNQNVELALKGEWETECNANTGSTETLRFNDGQYERIERAYLDETCQEANMGIEMRYHGKYRVTGNSSPDPAARDIEFWYTKRSIALLDDTVVSHFNETKKCNKDDWVKGEVIDMGTTCNSDYNTYYDIVKVQDNKLYLGQLTETHFGLNPDTRPISFGKTAYLRK